MGTPTSPSQRTVIASRCLYGLGEGGIDPRRRAFHATSEQMCSPPAGAIGRLQSCYYRSNGLQLVDGGFSVRQGSDAAGGHMHGFAAILRQGDGVPRTGEILVQP